MPGVILPSRFLFPPPSLFILSLSLFLSPSLSIITHEFPSLSLFFFTVISLAQPQKSQRFQLSRWRFLFPLPLSPLSLSSFLPLFLSPSLPLSLPLSLSPSPLSPPLPLSPSPPLPLSPSPALPLLFLLLPSSYLSFLL